MSDEMITLDNVITDLKKRDNRDLLSYLTFVFSILAKNRYFLDTMQKAVREDNPDNAIKCSDELIVFAWVMAYHPEKADFQIKVKKRTPEA